MLWSETRISSEIKSRTLIHGDVIQSLVGSYSWWLWFQFQLRLQEERDHNNTVQWSMIPLFHQTRLWHFNISERIAIVVALHRLHIVIIISRLHFRPSLRLFVVLDLLLGVHVPLLDVHRPRMCSPSVVDITHAVHNPGMMTRVSECWNKVNDKL